MQFTRNVFSGALVLLWLCPLQAGAQSDRLVFETATIKPSKSDGNAVGNRFGPELATWTNVSLRILIQNVYNLKDYQILSAPGLGEHRQVGHQCAGKRREYFPTEDTYDEDTDAGSVPIEISYGDQRPSCIRAEDGQGRSEVPKTQK